MNKCKLKPLMRMTIASFMAGSCPLMALAASTSWEKNYAEGLAAENNQEPIKAGELFAKALKEMATEPHKQEDQEICLGKLADSLLLRSKTAEAQKVYQNLLTLLKSRYGPNSPKAAPIILRLGSIQESLGNHSAAMDYYEQALKLNQRSYGPYSPEFAVNLHRMGKANFLAGHKTAALKQYKQALSILTEESGLKASNEMKSLLKDYGDLIKADENSNTDLITDFDKEILGNEKVPKISAGASGGSAWQDQNSFTLRAQEQSTINEDPQVVLRGLDKPTSDKNLAPVYKTMSDTIFGQSHFQRGEEFYKRKIAIAVQALGPDHPSVANDLCGLAVFYMSRSDYAQAKPLLARALPIYEKAWGENNILTINTRTSLATAEFHLGNNETAAALYNQALSHGQATLGPNSLETARILNDLAYLSYHQGKLEEARTFYQWALASTEGAVGQRDPLLAACLKDYAQVLRGLGRTDEAGAVESRALSILKQ